MALPTTRDEWRERFKDGMTWADVEEAHEAGLMRDERYHSLFAEISKHCHTGAKDALDIERRDNWRCFWEPKF